MPNTFELIASSTVGSGGAADITFTSIASTYTDLVLKCSIRSAQASIVEGIYVRFNSDTGANYNYRRLYGNGASAVSDSVNGTLGAPIFIDGASATASTFGNLEIYIPNYAGSAQKSFSADAVVENNGTTAYAGIMAGLWTNTAAITSVTLKSENAVNFLQYSTAYLYGVKNA